MRARVPARVIGASMIAVGLFTVACGARDLGIRDRRRHGGGGRSHRREVSNEFVVTLAVGVGVSGSTLHLGLAHGTAVEGDPTIMQDQVSGGSSATKGG